MRALDIFGRVNGQQSPEVMNTLQSLRNVRLKRKERESAEERKNRVEELGEEDEGVVTSESKPASAGMTSSSSSSRLNAQNSVPVDDPTKLEFADDDAMGRMMAANTFFERQMYSYAEKMIFEAYTIFMRQNGPDHPSTQAAKQNLGVVRNNSLNQLWMQVVAEEVMRIEEESYQASLKNNSAEGANKSGTASSTEESKHIDDYAALMAKTTAPTGKLEDQWLSSHPRHRQGCVVC